MGLTRREGADGANRRPLDGDPPGAADADELAAAVAAELGEPLDDVRPSVLIGTIALNGQLGPEAAAVAAIEAELARLQSAPADEPPDRAFAVDSLDDLLAETQALEAEGSLDLETIVAIQRASGAIAARTDRRLVVLLHRYAVTRRLIWERCVDRDRGRPAGSGPPRARSAASSCCGTS